MDDPTGLTYYFDASVQVGVAEALAAVRDDIRWAGQPGMPARDALDDEWLDFAATEGFTVFMRDKRIRTRPRERLALVQPGLRGAFVLTSAGNLSKWKTLELIVNRWSGIQEKLEELDAPFVCSVTAGGGVKQLSVNARR